MRILVTNDDGINAPGLVVLQEIASQLGDEVWTVAPETDQSGLSHSLSLSNPLRLRQLSERTFALRGTPTDCVIMGVREVLPQLPDIVLSGVNSGHNVSDDVTYSGTIAAAMEGTLLGVPSIALSQAYDWSSGDPIPWDVTRQHATKILQDVISNGIPEDVLINVNFPDCKPDEVCGVEVTRQGRRTHGIFIDARNDAQNNPYYWLSYQRNPEEAAQDADISAVQRNYISVTPLKLDLTADDELAHLKNLER